MRGIGMNSPLQSRLLFWLGVFTFLSPETKIQRELSQVRRGGLLLGAGLLCPFRPKKAYSRRPVLDLTVVIERRPFPCRSRNSLFSLSLFLIEQDLAEGPPRSRQPVRNSYF